MEGNAKLMIWIAWGTFKYGEQSSRTNQKP